VLFLGVKNSDKLTGFQVALYCTALHTYRFNSSF
jgi:hypothetical protein